MTNFGSKPNTVEPLSSLSNYVYKVQMGDQTLVVKLTNPNFKNSLKINWEHFDDIMNQSDYFKSIIISTEDAFSIERFIPSSHFVLEQL